MTGSVSRSAIAINSSSARALKSPVMIGRFESERASIETLQLFAAAGLSQRDDRHVAQTLSVSDCTIWYSAGSPPARRAH